MRQITQNVYVEEKLVACNLGLITTSKGVVLVDSPMRPTDTVKWRDEVTQKGEVQYLINTEEHADHWTGTWFLPGVLVSSLETRNILSKTPRDNPLNIIKRTNPEGLPLAKDYQVRLADIAFSESMELHVGDLTFQLFSNKGHSPGGIAVYVPQECVVFATDIVFYQQKSWLKEAVPEHWLASIKKLKELDIEWVVPGHGEVCKKDYLDVQGGIIQQWIDVIKSAVAQGWTREEAIAKIKIPDPYPKDPRTFGTEQDLNRDIISHLFDIYSPKTTL